MFGVGLPEFLLLCVGALLILGPRRLPEALRTLGLWQRRIASGYRSLRWEIERDYSPEQAQPQAEQVIKNPEQTQPQAEQTIKEPEPAQPQPQQTIQNPKQAQPQPQAGATIQTPRSAQPKPQQATKNPEPEQTTQTSEQAQSEPSAGAKNSAGAKPPAASPKKP